MGAIQLRDCRTAEEVISNYREVRARIRALRPPAAKAITPPPSTGAEEVVGVKVEPLPAPESDIAQLAYRMARLEARLDAFLKKEQGNAPERWPSLREIRHVVCEHYGVTTHDLDSKSREAPIRDIRHVAVYLCRKHTIKSFPEIARMFGGRDHTTALHSVRTIERRIASESDFAAKIAALNAKVIALP